MADPSVLDLYFPALVAGCKSTAPLRSMQEPASPFLWRDSLNMLVRDGCTIGRPGFNSSFGAGNQPPFTTPLGVSPGVSEIPRFIHYGDALVVVTNCEIWILYSGTWRNLTPTYSVGTVSATNGSPNITGAGGMLWQSRKVFGVITIDGAEYGFVATGETTATLTANFVGATGAGKAYSVKRIFGEISVTSPGNEVFAVIYNGDLYVTGNGMYPGAGQAVIKVSDIFTSTPTSKYITAGDDLTGTLDFNTTLRNKRIVGIAILQDSRVVIAAGNYAFYSSHLDDTVWTVSPGGGTPTAEVPRFTALGRIGSSLTFHHEKGIVYGDPTGLSDPPLRFQASSARIGAISAMTVKPYLSGEAFLAADGDVKMFDGNSVVSLGDWEMGSRIRALGSSFTSVYYWAWVNDTRNEYVLFQIASNASSPTKFWICQQDRWWPCETDIVLGALSDVTSGVASTTLGTSFQPAVVAVSGSKSSVGDSMRLFKEGADDTTGTPTYFLETDDIDHGQPLFHKTPQRVFLWAKAAMTTIRLAVRYAAESAFNVTVTKDAKALMATSYDFQPGQISNAPKAATAHRYELRGTNLRLGIFGLHIRASLGGSREMVGSDANDSIG